MNKWKNDQTLIDFVDVLSVWPFVYLWTYCFSTKSPLWSSPVLFLWCTTTQFSLGLFPANFTADSKMLFQSQETKKGADYLMLRAHADPPQQPPLLFAEDAVNLPHWWEVQLIWWPIAVKGVSLVIIHAAVDHFSTKSKFKQLFLVANLTEFLGLSFNVSHLVCLDCKNH